MVDQIFARIYEKIAKNFENRDFLFVRTVYIVLQLVSKFQPNRGIFHEISRGVVFDTFYNPEFCEIHSFCIIRKNV